jgi:hypothetical protein
MARAKGEWRRDVRRKRRRGTQAIAKRDIRGGSPMIDRRKETDPLKKH